MANFVLVACCLLTVVRRTGAKQVHAKDLLPYLIETPPTPQVDIKFCNIFQVVEKPYYILFGSCWLCALMQQLIDLSRIWEEKMETLGKTQKAYVGVQLVFLVLETVVLLCKIGWMDGASLWQMYNLYVYIFVHSSVFVRSVMMSMIVWDWYNAKLLKRPIFGAFDATDYADYERAFLLIGILQFGSSAFVMAVVTLTHVIPGLILYHPVFLLTSAFIIKVRSWLDVVGLDPDGRVGRGLVMASNSFVAVAGCQIMITSMVRVYEGALDEDGYVAPIFDDFESRDMSTWYECHLRQGWGAFSDQDFLNLFVR